MSKDSRSGGKYSGNHTTLIPAAAIVCDIAHACPSVMKISPSFITSGLRSAQGKRRVKIIEDGGNILLWVRDNTSCQEVRIYVSNMQAAKLAVARGARNANIGINFGKMPDK
ncbi:MAG: hypothetical protein A3B13_00255 [Candidatus Liptonbacteria bacterium RIFCSPLOWO2_01_FULL_45_15]|uniref:Uncharacterized protein n=1 Tax=Candidatus Liptonbacteria bacterium RIFCSPLOWO2_01_FULL_45_15 TaxID=1798649 RepID=A0A1G2CIV8_9BACT|nr:MAG: hypothetical protein A3B13_00255 [Candidatus Liptonbacteria bacterium RIFCSPLOWO2_01_FULL_45_15]